MNTDRLIDYVTKGVLQRLHADETFLDSLADKLRASSLGSMVRELAREEIGHLELRQLEVFERINERLTTVECRKVDLDLETELERVAKLPGKPS
jgi:trehalose-6-phosphate synthase